MKAEREKIEQERAESQKMMAELLELKAQLAAKGKQEKKPESADSPSPTAWEETNAPVENASYPPSDESPQT